MAKIKLIGFLKNEQDKITLDSMGIYEKEKETILFQKDKVTYFLNLKTKEFKKEDQESILMLQWRLNEETEASYLIKELNQSMNLLVQTDFLSLKENSFEVGYHIKEEQDKINLKISWEEVYER